MSSKVIVGIDLGTTYSCVAVFRDDQVEIIANDQTGERTTPSCVAFAEGERLIGKPAKDQISANPTNTVYDVKRLIGRRFNDPEVQSDIQHWNFKVVGEDNKPKIQVMHNGQMKKFAPEEISAMVLGRMKEIAEAYLGEKVTNAVITVPAYFNDSQRQATKDAGTIAGLNVVRIINEPTAAALAFGLNRLKKGERNFLVFDLGGGTFDVSILTLDEGVFEVKATTGNCHLGGEDFDNRLVHYLIEEIKRKHMRNLTHDKRARRRLQAASEQAKRNLSANVQTKIMLENLFDQQDVNLTITRAKFEEICADLFQTTLEYVQKALDDAKMNKSEIDDIVLVGGSTRIPKIQKMLQDFFDGKPLNRQVNPDEAVAYGAALQGAVLSDEENTKVEDIVLIDVTPLSLGIEVINGEMNVLIKRNTPIPAKETKMFTTHKDKQTAVSFNVYEGERVRVADNNLLGSFQLSGIRPLPPGGPQIEVTFEIDENGITNVSARDTDTGNQSNITINRDNSRLSPEEISRMIQEANHFREQDLKLQEKIVAKNQLEEYAYKMRDSISNKSILDKIEKTINWLESNPNVEARVFREHYTHLEIICKQSLENNSPKPKEPKFLNGFSYVAGGLSRVSLETHSDSDSDSSIDYSSRAGPKIEELE